MNWHDLFVPSYGKWLISARQFGSIQTNNTSTWLLCHNAGQHITTSKYTVNALMCIEYWWYETIRWVGTVRRNNTMSQRSDNGIRKKTEHTRLHHLLSVVYFPQHSFVDIRWTREPNDRSSKNCRQCWPTKTAQNWERSCQLYASRTTKLRTRMSSSSTEQSRAAK